MARWINDQPTCNLTNARWFGPSIGVFLTHNPVLQENALAQRLCAATVNNYRDISARGQVFMPPTSNDRQRNLRAHPLAAALTYIRMFHAIHSALINFPHLNRRSTAPAVHHGPPSAAYLQSDWATASPPAAGDMRQRGVFGPINGYSGAHETSAAGHQHFHVILFSPLTWLATVRPMAHEPAISRNIGQFFESIVQTSVRDNVWQEHHMHTAEWVIPTDTPNPETHPVDWQRHIDLLAMRRQNHMPHNFSCFKKVDEARKHTHCRFGMPRSGWDQESAIIRVCYFRDRTPRSGPVATAAHTSQAADQPTEPVDPRYAAVATVLKVHTKIDPLPPASAPTVENPFPIETRALVVELQRPTQDDATCRTIADLAAAQTTYVPDPIAVLCQNSWIAEFSGVLLGATQGQNNVQLLPASGLDHISYIAKYVAKGDGEHLTACLALFQEAVETSTCRPSTAEDTAVNDLRPAMRVLMRFVNNVATRSKEYSIRQCLSSLLGLDQFYHSHPTASIFVHSARAAIAARLGVLHPATNHTVNQVDQEEISLWNLEADAENEAASTVHRVTTEITGDHQGTRAAQATTLRPVFQHQDYEHRPVELAALNLLEFACVCDKRGHASASPTSRAKRAGDREPEKADDNSPRDGRGRKANAVYKFRQAHPQRDSADIALVSLLRIPKLAGSRVPVYPGPEPAAPSPEKADADALKQHDADLKSWRRSRDDFATYMLTMMCPWSLDSGVPPYSFNWTGFSDFYQNLQRLAASNDQPTTPAPNVPAPRPAAAELSFDAATLAAGRLQYIQNCVAVSQRPPFHRQTERLFRDRSAHTFEEYQALRQEMDPAYDREWGAIEREQVTSILETIKSLRERFDASHAAELQGGTRSSARHVQRDRQELLDDTVTRMLMSIFPTPERLLHSEPDGDDSEAAVAAAAGLAGPTPDRFQPDTQRLDPTYAKRACLQVDVNACTQHWQQVQQLTPPPPSSASTSGPPDRVAAHPAQLLPNLDPAIMTVPPGLNEVQKQIYMRYVTALRSGTQFLEIWLGMPGCGKTFIADLIRDATGTLDKTVVCAPTGKAAALHRGGRTIHKAFGFSPTVTPEKLAQPNLNCRRGRESVWLLFRDVRTVIIDECSMPSIEIILCIDKRLRQLGDPEKPFGGFHVIFLGDFQQLEPVNSIPLFKAIIYEEEEEQGHFTKQPRQRQHLVQARELLRPFRVVRLTQLMRSAGDPVLQKLLLHMADTTTESAIPLSWLSPTCPKCVRGDGTRAPDPTTHKAFGDQCEESCSHRCHHFKELLAEEVAQDPAWENARIITPLNSTVDAVTLLRLRQVAAATGQVVYKWRLPQFPRANNNQSMRPADALRLTNEEAQQFPNLWGYFLYNAPITISYNANTVAGISNGVSGHLVGMAMGPSDESQAAALTDAELHATQLAAGTLSTAGTTPSTSGRHVPGDIVTLPTPPSFIFIKLAPTTATRNVSFPQCPVPGLSESASDPIIGIPVNCTAGDEARRLTVTVASDANGKITSQVVDPGYYISYASTVYAAQGDTIDRVIANLNLCANNPGDKLLSLNAIYVMISRVRMGQHLRIVPWIRATGTSHLHNLRHDEDYDRFLKCYDAQGRFVPGSVPARRVGPAPSSRKQTRRADLNAAFTCLSRDTHHLLKRQRTLISMMPAPFVPSASAPGHTTTPEPQHISDVTVLDEILGIPQETAYSIDATAGDFLIAN